MSSLLKLYIKTDFIGPTFGLEEQNSTMFKTFPGAFFSSLVFAASLIIAFMFGQEVYQRKKPNVSQSQEYLEVSNVYLKDYPILYTFYYPNATLLPDPLSYFDSRTYTVTIDDKSHTSVNTNLTLGICDLTKYSLRQDLINEVVLGGAFTPYCLNFTDSTRFENGFGGQPSVYIQTVLSKCNSEYRTCNENLDEDINSGLVVALITFDAFVDSTSYETPIKYYFNRYAQPLSYGASKIINLRITNNVYYSDNGWILQDIETNSYISQDSVKTDLNISAGRYVNDVFCLILESPLLRNRTDRTYLKVQELFARIGGIVTAFMIVVKVITGDLLRFNYLFFVRTNSFLNNDKKENQVFTVNFEQHEPKKQEQNVIIPFSNNNMSNSNILYPNNPIISDILKIGKVNLESSNLGNTSNLNNLLKQQTHIKKRSYQNVREIKEHLCSHLFAPKKFELKADEISYTQYWIAFLCCNKKREARYKYEITRVKQLLDIKLFQHFIYEEYEKKYKDKETCN